MQFCIQKKGKPVSGMFQLGSGGITELKLFSTAATEQVFITKKQ